jgi:hypothetical protein
MSDLFMEGTKGSGFRYFKKFLAVALQGAVIIGIVFVFQNVNAALIVNEGDILDVALGRVVISLTTVTLLLKSQTIANDIVGV